MVAPVGTLVSVNVPSDVDKVAPFPLTEIVTPCHRSIIFVKYGTGYFCKILRRGHFTTEYTAQYRVYCPKFFHNIKSRYLIEKVPCAGIMRRVLCWL